MNWVTLEGLLRIHAQVIDETGGIRGVVNFGAIESALRRPFTSIGGIEMFPSLADKAAALIHSIVAFHPFSDGNKRTAFVAADVCLKLNGTRVKLAGQVEPFFWSIARGEQSVEQIAAWLAANIEPFSEPAGGELE